MADYPIVMRQLNNTGEYDTLYPTSTSDQIEGLLEETTKTAFGLSANAVPDDIFQKLANAITLNSTYGNLAVGSTVQLNVNGTPTNFIVVHQGNPDPSMYDESCNGTWLLMQNYYIFGQWNESKGSNEYASSMVNNYLNNTFLKLFDSDIQSRIKQIKIPYVNGTGVGGTVTSGINGLSVKVFLLSSYEVGITQNDYSDIFIIGSKLEYFDNGINGNANNKRIIYNPDYGNAVNWWTREPQNGYANYAKVISGSGTSGNGSVGASQAIRPCIIMPSDGLLLPNGNDVTTTISNILGIPGLQSQVESGVKIQTGSYVGTGTYGESNPNTLTFDFEPKLVMVVSQNSYSFGTNSGIAWMGQPGASNGKIFTLSGNSLSWYSSDGTASQLNNDGSIYYYFALG